MRNMSCYFHSNPFYHFIQNKKTSTINNNNLFCLVPRDVFFFNRRLYYFKHYPYCCYSLYVKSLSKQHMYVGICMFLYLFRVVSLKPLENTNTQIKMETNFSMHLTFDLLSYT